MQDDRARVDLKYRGPLLFARVIGRLESVTLKVNVAAMLKSQRNREYRPLVSLLFWDPIARMLPTVQMKRIHK